MRNLFRGLMGDQLLRRPAPEQRQPLDVHHRVLISCDRRAVWDELVTPAVPLFGEELTVVAVPESQQGPPTALAVLWRRANDRLRAGLGQVVAAEPPGLVVTRAVDGSAPSTLTTTLQDVDEGCIVDQRLTGITPGHATELRSAFALLWLQRGLIGLKERLEGGSPTSQAAIAASTGTVGAEPYSARLGAEIAALDAEVGGAALVPVAHDETIELSVSPDALWNLLLDPGCEPLLRPHTLSVTRVVVPGFSEQLHVALHEGDADRRSVTVSEVTEQVPLRIVERSLTSEFESAVMTQIEPTTGGSRLTESLVGSLPAGAGALSGADPAAALLRARLEAIRRIAEAGIQPQRDPRTGFLPPGFEPTAETPAPAAPVPSAVLLPPPHLPMAVPEHRPPRNGNVDAVMFTWGMA